jgi:hypothetical protein
MHQQHPAHRAHGKHGQMIADEPVLHRDSRAEYVAAFFNMSRSSVTRTSSFFTRRSCAARSASLLRTVTDFENSAFHVQSDFVVTHNRSATSQTACPHSTTCATGSRLNSSVNRSCLPTLRPPCFKNYQAKRLQIYGHLRGKSFVLRLGSRRRASNQFSGSFLG